MGRRAKGRSDDRFQSCTQLQPLRGTRDGRIINYELDHIQEFVLLRPACRAGNSGRRKQALGLLKRLYKISASDCNLPFPTIVDARLMPHALLLHKPHAKP